VKGDAVDEALGMFLNNFTDRGKIQVMFIRLQPGIYSFGSKKVCIKVDNGKINVRVGGGYMLIDEFLEKYTTNELEKSIREGIDPMGGDASPLKIPGSPSKQRLSLCSDFSPLKRPVSPSKCGSPSKLTNKLDQYDRLIPTAVSPLKESKR